MKKVILRQFQLGVTICIRRYDEALLKARKVEDGIMLLHISFRWNLFCSTWDARVDTDSQFTETQTIMRLGKTFTLRSGGLTPSDGNLGRRHVRSLKDQCPTDK